MDFATLDVADIAAFLATGPTLTGFMNGSDLREVRFGVMANGDPYVLAVMHNHAGVLLVKPRIRVKAESRPHAA